MTGGLITFAQAVADKPNLRAALKRSEERRRIAESERMLADYLANLRTVQAPEGWESDECGEICAWPVSQENEE